MKKLINIADPKNVIIVNDAYINGDRIVCDTGTDNFDLWRRDWYIEDLPGGAAADAKIISTPDTREYYGG